MLWRGVLAEREGDLAEARAAMSWFGPAEPERTSCLIWFKSLLELSAGDLDACRCELGREPTARPDYQISFRLVALELAVRSGEQTVADAAAELFSAAMTRQTVHARSHLPDRPSRCRDGTDRRRPRSVTRI